MGASLFRREREIKNETLDFLKRRRYEGGGGVRERWGREIVLLGDRVSLVYETGKRMATCHVS